LADTPALALENQNPREGNHPMDNGRSYNVGTSYYIKNANKSSVPERVDNDKADIIERELKHAALALRIIGKCSHCLSEYKKCCMASTTQH
jgi:hypothetical protein